MVDKYPKNRILIGHAILFLVIALMGGSCQKQQVQPDIVVEQVIPALVEETELQLWEWPAPEGCYPLSVSLDNVWGIFYCDPREQIPSDLMPGVWVERIEGNEVPILLAEMTSWPYIAWSPNGNEIVVTGSRGNILLFQVGNWEDKQVLYEVASQTGIDGNLLPHGMPIWSPDSQYIATVNPNLNAKLMFWQPSRKDASLLYSIGFKDENTYLSPKLDIGPTWSSDSKRIAFLTTSKLEMLSEELWIWDVERGKYEIAFKLENGSLSAPVWSPDDQMIVFSGGNEIVFFDLAEQLFRRVPFPEDNIIVGSQKFWSPDSTRLIVSVDMGWWLLTLADEEWQDLGNPYSFIERWIDDGAGLIVAVQEGDENVMKTIFLDQDSR